MRRLDLWGWVLFLLSAIAFTAVSFRDGDLLLAAGSLFFLVACVLFLIPYTRSRGPS
ncbi:MAG: hypothetical protein WD638_08195 [Nitriliruptoraceae bacterium]